MNTTSYHCPHCRQLLKHRAHLSGAKVQCGSCGGFYFEPSDPVPGCRPIKAEGDEAGISVTSPASQDINDAPPGHSLVDSATTANALPLASTVLRPANPDDLQSTPLLRSSRVLQPFEAAGQKATVISWSAEEPSGAKVGTTKNCTKDEANEMILRVAMKLIKRRWPDIYPLLSARMEREMEREFED